MSHTSDKDTQVRMAGVGGTIAERKFEELYPHKWMRTGFDRPKWSDGTEVADALPFIVTAMPDYLAYNNRSLHRPYWVEVKGAKGEYVNSIKVRHMDEMHEWQEFSGLWVKVFIWNSSKRKAIAIPLDSLAYLTESSELKQWHDGPWYYRMQWSRLEERAEWSYKL